MIVLLRPRNYRGLQERGVKEVVGVQSGKEL